MGNSLDSRVNILAKNWTQINAATYKNTITDELIDAHQLHARNEEQLSYNNSLLIKRAAINHPNVVKLIYFYEQAHNMAVCNNKKFKHRIYTEHSSSRLSTLVGASEQDKSACLCCAVMNGIGCLVEKYGYFGVTPAMVFFVNSVGFSKNEGKKIAKIWINQDLRVNYAQLICNQQEMCSHLLQLYLHFVQKKYCSKIQLNDLSKLTKFKDFFQHIYTAHKKLPYSTPIERKRVTSYPHNYQANKIQRNADFIHQSHNVANINNGKAKPINSYNQYSMLQKGFNTLSNFVSISKQSTFIPQQHIILQKVMPTVNPQQKLQNLFFKGQKKVKQFDLQQNSRHKIEKNKINFSYTDSLATPKHSKSFQQPKTTKFKGSPFEQITTAPFQSINNKKQDQNRGQQLSKRMALPVVSFFSSNPTVDIQQTTPLVFQSPIPKHKQIKQQHTSLQSSLAKTVEEKEEKKNLKPNQQLQVINISLSSSVEYSKPEKMKKQANLKLQKCFEIECNMPVQTSVKTLGSYRQRLTNNFEIVSEYRFSFQPEARIPKILIAQSDQFSKQSIEMFGGQQKEKYKIPKFYKHPHPEVTQSVQRQKTPFQSNHLILTSTYRASQTGQGSLSANPRSDNRFNDYAQKLQHLTKGITNSIKSVYSNETKQSIPGSLEPREYEEMNDKPFQCEFSKPFYRAGDQKTHNNVYMTNQIKRDPIKKRSSQLESYYSESDSLDQRKKVQILQKINNTEKILEQNKKKLERLQLEKDLEVEKDMIKKEMEILLKNNMMADESHRIKEKVKHKKATFAELKAEASKILNDLNL